MKCCKNPPHSTRLLYFPSYDNIPNNETTVIIVTLSYNTIRASIVKIIGHFKKDKGLNESRVPHVDGASAIPRVTCFIT